jgi:hypothetical protein
MAEETYEEFRLSMIGKPVEVGVYTDTVEFPGEPIDLVYTVAGVLQLYVAGTPSDPTLRAFKVVGGENADILSKDSLLIITVRE